MVCRLLKHERDNVPLSRKAKGVVVGEAFATNFAPKGALQKGQSLAREKESAISVMQR